MKLPIWHSPHSIKNSFNFYLIRTAWSSLSNKIVKSPPFFFKEKKNNSNDQIQICIAYTYILQIKWY